MNYQVAEALAKQLIAEHIPTWTFEWDSAVRRLGCCHYKTRKITLSYRLTIQAPEDVIKDTILHEIAHALAGFHAAHGPTWRSVARSVGCTADRCYDVAAVGRIKGRWAATCPNCKREFTRHKPKTSTELWCRACGRALGQLVFRDTLSQR